MKYVNVIIVAAGESTRMKEDKMFLELLNKPIAYYSIEPFEKHENIEEIVLAAKLENKKHLESLINKYGFKKINKIVKGGETRQDSACEGLKALDKASIVLIHNAANPLVTEKEITDVIKATEEYDVAAVGYPVKDTIKKADAENFVIKTLRREGLWQIQTPQGMKYEIAIQAFEQAYKDNFIGTDDVSLAERIGYKVKLVECSRNNIKITYPEDLQFAEQILRRKTWKSN